MTRDVTACLVTRGDQPAMIKRIRESLIFRDVVVWDNAVRPDWKVAGRYMAAAEATTEYVYFQDDDVVVPDTTQQELASMAGPGLAVTNWAHGNTPDGYQDIPLVGAGAVIDRTTVLETLFRYAQQHPLDDEFKYEADFVLGALYPDWLSVRLPFEIVLPVAQHPSRLCNQPWQQQLKQKLTDRARALRPVPA